MSRVVLVQSGFHVTILIDFCRSCRPYHLSDCWKNWETPIANIKEICYLCIWKWGWHYKIDVCSCYILQLTLRKKFLLPVLRMQSQLVSRTFAWISSNDLSFTKTLSNNRHETYAVLVTFSSAMLWRMLYSVCCRKPGMFHMSSKMDAGNSQSLRRRLPA